jgi:hypothetical protein
MGVLLAFVGYLFKYIEGRSFTIFLKLIWCLFSAVVFAVIAEYSTLANSRYLANLSFGYTSYRLWGENGRPTKELGWFWWGF